MTGAPGAGASGTSRLAGVVLAAGAGTRLRPLTLLRPKALCPVGGVPLLDLALRRLEPLTGPGSDRLAVNAHHHAAMIEEHLGGHLAAGPGGVRLSVERPAALGTAGALGALREWIDGRDVVLTNADAYLPDGLGAFADGWDGERCRLLCVPVAGRGDFAWPGGAAPGLRYVGACVLPWRLVEGVPATPSGLYEVLWRSEAAAGRLDLVTPDGVGAPVTTPDGVLDCGTPEQYLRANLDAVRRAGGSIVAPGAQIGGRVVRSLGPAVGQRVSAGIQPWTGDDAEPHAGGDLGSWAGDDVEPWPRDSGESRVVDSVVGAGAVVEGSIERCVVWDGAVVVTGEHLADAVRAAGPQGPFTVS